MEELADHLGRVVVPKELSDRLHLTAGTRVDGSECGDSIDGSPARLERRDGKLVAVGMSEVTDEDVSDILRSVRRAVDLELDD